MNTKQVIISTVFSFLVFSSFAQSNFEKRANPDDYSIPVMKAITYGLTAPSPHNTQAWFIDTLSNSEMLLYVKHLIPETDPPARSPNHP